VTIPDFDPVIIHLGPFALRWYALAYVVGILLGWRYAVSLARRAELWGARARPSPIQIDDIILWITLGVIVGGRVGYLIFYRIHQQPPLMDRPMEILELWNGGMSFHGGLLGVAIAMILFAWRNRMPLMTVSDLIAPVAPIGLFFGRVANFINGELWGRPTDLPWGIVFCNTNIKATYGQCPEGARHPSQLYEAGLEGVVLFVILWLTIRNKGLRRPGLVTGLFLTGYGLFRALLENVREPDSFMPASLQGHITMGMLLSIPMILLGLFLIVRALRKPAMPDAAPEAA
jgi:phosphatidylglycerol:prolipoprotein diacylglycerol transferase